MNRFITLDNVQLIVQNTPAAVAMFDKEMKYMIASDRWIKDYKLEGQEIIGRSHYDVFPEIRNLPYWLDLHRRTLNGEVIKCDEEQWKKPDGTSEWLKYALHPWHDQDGNVCGLIMFTEVITQRKIIESELEESEKTFRAVMELSPIGMALVDLDGKWLKVNSSLCRLLGYEKSEFLATNFQKLTHRDDLESDLEQVQQLLDGLRDSYSMEKRYITKLGEIVWAVLNVTLIRDESGKPKHFLSQITDITAQKAIDEIKDEFISLVSHELKTPITSVSLALNMLSDYKASVKDPSFSQFLLLAERNCRRLSDLITDIVDLNRIKVGLFTHNKESVNIATVISRAVEDNLALASSYKVSFVVNEIPSDIYVDADTDRLVQVLTNFLSNAAKFSKEGGTIIVCAEVCEGSVTVFVEDRGSGIPKEFQEHVFQKFMQADHGANRKKEGTGLGLYISKEMIEAMGGQIGFTSQSDNGTSFWFSFPTS